MHKVGGQFETRGYLVEYAHFARSVAVSIIANSMVGHPLESLPVPLTQNMSTCIIILRTGGIVWAFRRIIPLATKIVWGHCPPQVKYCGGACPPPAPPRFRRLWLCDSVSVAAFNANLSFAGGSLLRPRFLPQHHCLLSEVGLALEGPYSKPILQGYLSLGPLQ